MDDESGEFMARAEVTGVGRSSPLSSDRQHLSCDVCLEVRGEII